MSTRASRHSQRNEGDLINGALDSMGLLKRGTDMWAVNLGAGDGHRLNTVRHLGEDWGWSLAMFDAKAAPPDVQEAWITRTNVNDLLAERKVPFEPEVMSVDLEGNDYWIWKTMLEEGNRRPKLIITKVNVSLIPQSRQSIEYNEGHRWAKDDYFGASFGAYLDLFTKHQYVYVACQPVTGHVLFARRDLWKEKAPAPTAPPHIGHYYPASRVRKPWVHTGTGAAIAPADARPAPRPTARSTLLKRKVLGGKRIAMPKRTRR